jgi:long-chain fatty acid transport protein
VNKLRFQIAFISTALGVVAFANGAHAVNGDLLIGAGVIQKSLAGGGVANSEDATAIAINPAGIVGVGQQINAAIGVLAPFPEYIGAGTGFITPGTVQSDQNAFPMPSVFYSQPIDGESAFGVGVYGNGGLGTSYSVYNPNTHSYGVFGGGVAGVNLLQGFISAAYAHRFGNISIGVAPILSVQRLVLWGGSAIEPLSSDPSQVTNKGYDWGVGVGLRAGAQWDVAPGWRVAVAGQTPVADSDFQSYRGLLPGHGSLNAPATITAGIAWDALPAATLLFDYKHIFFSGVGTLGNSSQIPQFLGTDGGPGFGWRDMDIFTIGGEWRATPSLTLRAGYSHNNQIVRSSNIVFDIFAPNVLTDHISAGLSYKVADNWSVEAAAIFSPRQNVSGAVGAAFGGGTVTLSTWLFEAIVGFTYKFDTTPAPLIAKY